MQSALSSPDILYEIFTQFAKLPHPRYDTLAPPRAELLQAALTCRIFRKPALKALWSRLPSLHHLLRIAAPDYKVIRDDISKDRWTRFQEYASWVTVLFVDYTALRSPILTQICRRVHGRPLLPSLKRLLFVWDREAMSLPPETMILVSPTLRELHMNLRMAEGNPILPVFLERIATGSPHLMENLSIRFRDIPGQFLMHLDRFSSLAYLDLKVDDVPGRRVGAQPFFPVLEMRRLETLSVSAELLLALSSSFVFDSLVEIIIEGPFPLLVPAVARVAAPHLRCLDLHCAGELSNDVDMLLGNSLAAVTVDHANLFSFSLHMEEAQVTVQARDFFKPFSCFFSAKTLSFKYGGSLLWNDDDARSIFSSMSGVSDLEIRFNCNPGDSTLTLTGLGILAKVCPELDSLRVPINTRLGEDAQLPPCLSRCALRSLEVVGESIIDAYEPARVALFLDCAFPGLDWCYAKAKNEREGRRWEDVFRILKLFQHARRVRRASIEDGPSSSADADDEMTLLDSQYP
ncbi:hypothetical protein OE88DRAFT_1734314 [Heliocybe sulcata]|uniref:F-box domain-containing protein n=1 Tax=Heliocybe sulcata TaxID=5364 RepID=A0A5C3N756_9AGAM|nr:hypothetical protein OE88DRAFT_1734314 [Heliocybe sulcata]